MKRTLILILPIIFAFAQTAKNWSYENHNGYRLFHTQTDQPNDAEYAKLMDNGITTVNQFFKAPYKKPFDIYIHPTRQSIDSTWQSDWKMPDFKSECWMVASGVAIRLDVISPKTWNKSACEHDYTNKDKTQQLLTHELTHVFHGQSNASPDFSDVEAIDWFVEGLATYASGQCDAARIADVKQLVSENKAPNTLNNFWKGKSKYGLSGSMVQYIDRQYGRKKLIALLPFNKKTQILEALQTSEAELLNGWKTYISKL